MRVLLAKILLAATVATAVPVFSQESLAVAGGTIVQADDGGAVLRVDLATAAVTVLATPSPGNGLTGIAALPDGRVFVSTANNTTAGSHLLQIDPVTGALIQDVGELEVDSAPIVVHDLAADPTTGLIYGVEVAALHGQDGGRGGTNMLMTIDPATAVVTVIGFPNIKTTNFMAIAFDAAGTLWAKPITDPELYSLDKATAQVSTTVVLDPGVGALGLGFAGDGTFAMSECCSEDRGTGGGVGNTLYRVDPLAGTATLVGLLGGDRRVHDFAIPVDPGGAPGPAIVEVPAVDRVGLALLAALVALAGLIWLRR
jgi:hypothetical protein